MAGTDLLLRGEAGWTGYRGSRGGAAAAAGGYRAAAPPNHMLNQATT